MIPSETQSDATSDIYSSLPKLLSSNYSDVPSPSAVDSNMPCDIYYSLPKLVPRMLPSGITSSAKSDTKNDTLSLEPSSSSTL